MGKTVEKAKKKGKKKGRPSLLDLQKRSLRLQKQLELEQQHQKHPKHRSPNPNPYLRPVPQTSGRRTARRSSNPEGPETADEDDEEEYEDEDDEGGGRRREKKLQHVLRATPDGRSGDRGELGPSASESEGEGRAEVKRRRVDDVGAVRGSTRDKIGGYKSYSKVTDPSQGQTSDLEDGTPLPDTQLLIFILDRLQKKDTYGVFSEPVDPEELPDYHDIIDHPMDFSTVRKKLGDGVYKNLEQFEKDVFLISANAMHYNAPDTIYFRQARAIQELAKKDFENLRQDTDEDELEQQTVRRGRPPSKSAGKKPMDRSPTLFGGSNSSSIANAIERNGKCTTLADTLRKGLIPDKSYQCNMSSSRASQGPRNIEKSHFSVDLKFDRNDDPLGSVMKGLSSRYGKKAVSSEDNRRNSYNQPSSVSSAGEPSILTTFDGEAKELIPVGLHMEHAYARSVARFAANLGPVGWKIAAEKIKRALPPGTKFGRGWIDEDDAAPRYQPPMLPISSLPPCLRPDSPGIPESNNEPEKLEDASENLSSPIPHSPPVVPAGADKNFDAKKTREIPGCNNDKLPNVTGEKLDGASETFVSHTAHSSPVVSAGTKSSEAKQSTEISGCNDSKVQNVSGIQQKHPVEFHQTSPVQSNINGLNARFAYNLCQFERMPNSEGQIGSLGGKLPVAYSRGMDLGNKSNLIRTPATVQVETDKSKYSLASSSNSSFEQSGSSHLDSQRGKESRNTMNIQSNFFIPASTTYVEAERARLSTQGTVSSGSGFGNSISVSRFEMETKMTNQNMSNPVPSSINDSLVGHFGSQRVMETGHSSVNVSNSISNNPATVNCLDGDRMKARNITSASSSIDSFNHPKPFNNFEIERSKLGNISYMNSSYYYMHPTGTSQMIGGDASKMNPDTSSIGEPVLESQGPWRGSSLHQKSDSAPPDLNVRFQPPGSPASSALVDSQQPDLALQL